MPELIAQGAEAKIYRDGEKIIKDRFAKSYRHPELDSQLRTSRTKREALIMHKLPGIVPAVIREEKTSLVMERIDGTMVKEVLDEHPALGREIGRLLAELHKKHIMHADLTTSNMILQPDGTIRLIDFGLSYVSRRVEDMAVDLHLLRQAFESKHVAVWETAFQAVLEGYRATFPLASEVLERFKVVEHRGRNKQAY